MASTTGIAPETTVGQPDDGSEGGASGLGRKGGLPVGCEPDDLPTLLHRYYWSEPAAEVLGHDPSELAALALGHLRLAEVRPQGSATVDVERGSDDRAIVRLITDDMPFLVDSVTAE